MARVVARGARRFSTATVSVLLEPPRTRPRGDLYALYRDVAPRDMSVARWDGAAWEALEHAGVVHATVWTGIPEQTGLFYVRHDRGRWDPPHLLAALVAVWDMRDPSARLGAVFASHSRDGGTTWSAPRRISGRVQAGYPRAAHLSGRFRVVWIEEEATHKTLRHLTL